MDSVWISMMSHDFGMGFHRFCMDSVWISKEFNDAVWISIDPTWTSMNIHACCMGVNELTLLLYGLSDSLRFLYISMHSQIIT